MAFTSKFSVLFLFSLVAMPLAVAQANTQPPPEFIIQSVITPTGPDFEPSNVDVTDLEKATGGPAAFDLDSIEESQGESMSAAQAASQNAYYKTRKYLLGATLPTQAEAAKKRFTRLTQDNSAITNRLYKVYITRADQKAKTTALYSLPTATGISAQAAQFNRRVKKPAVTPRTAPTGLLRSRANAFFWSR
jgi:hypothetical protein